MWIDAESSACSFICHKFCKNVHFCCKLYFILDFPEENYAELV